MPLTAIAAGVGAPHRRALVWIAALAAAPLAILPMKARALELPAVDGPFPTNHTIHLRTDRPAPASVHDGVGLYAMAKSHAVDLTNPDQVMNGPKSPYAQAAGLAWRRANMTAMFGYMRPSNYHSAYFSDDHTASFRISNRVGLGFALHY